MDFLGAVSLAQIRVLLVPVGDIHLEVFEKWAAEIRDFKEIKLSDIPGDSRDDRGTCLYSYDDSMPLTGLSSIYAKPFGERLLAYDLPNAPPF